MAASTAAPAAPTPVRKVATHTLHGRTRTDAYGWLRDDNWSAVVDRTVPLRADIAAHLRTENEYADAVLAPAKPLADVIFAEIKGRVNPNAWSLPLPDGPWEYYSRFSESAEQPITARRPRGTVGSDFGGEEVLVDGPALRAGRPFYAIGRAQHSSDHRLVAYSEDTAGSERYTIQVKDLATGELFPGPAEHGSGDFRFSRNGEWLFWIWSNPESRPTRVYRRPTRGGEDVLVYEEKNPGYDLELAVLSDDSHVAIRCGTADDSETWVIPADDPTGPPRCVAPRRRPQEEAGECELHAMDHWGDRWVVRTNAGGAVDFKIMTAPHDRPGREHWTDLLPHLPGHYVERVHALAGHLVWMERFDVDQHIYVVTREDVVGVGAGGIRALARELPLEQRTCVCLRLGMSYEFATSVIRFSVQTPTAPERWYALDLADGLSGGAEKTLVKEQVIPSGHDPDDYVAERLHAPAADGVLVPVTVLRRRDVPLDGTAPLWNSAYGAYGIMYPRPGEFSITDLSLADRGWMVARSHVRGGAEKGRQWYYDGRREKKMNSVTDFIACSEHLVREGYAAAGRIVPYGYSAGGIVAGAALNAAPHLWAGVVARYPFVDVLNSMCDASLPLTPLEYPEWGNPAESARDYDAIAAYAPYENVREGVRYPPVLAQAGVFDVRVTYWEPAKWVAKLRYVSGGGEGGEKGERGEGGEGGGKGGMDEKGEKREQSENSIKGSAAPMLCRVNPEAGHSGMSGRYEGMREEALMRAFAIWAVQRRDEDARAGANGV